MTTSHRVTHTYQRTVTYYIEGDIQTFLEDNVDFEPGDVPGLIDVVSDEIETCVNIADNDEGITVGFAVVDGEIVELS